MNGGLRTFLEHALVNAYAMSMLDGDIVAATLTPNHRNSHPSPSLPLSSVFSSLRLRCILEIVLQFCSTDAPTSSAGLLLLHTAHTSLHCFILIHLPPFLHPSSRPSPNMSYSYATAKAVLSDVDKDRILAMHLSQSDISNVSRQCKRGLTHDPL